MEAGLCLAEAPAHYRATVNPLPSIKGKVLRRDTAAASSQLLLSSQLGLDNLSTLEGVLISSCIV